MARRFPDADFEDYGVVELCEWLQKEQNCDDDIIKAIREAEVTGRIFLDLNDDDLKDIFTSFLQRKKIRGILKELNNPDEEPETPEKKRKVDTPKRPTAMSPQTAHTPATPNVLTPAIPHSAILLEPQMHPASALDKERKKVIRLSMDSLIAMAGERRPTDIDVLNLGRILAITYPILRDKPSEAIRENYKSVVGFLRRRMYNITPAQTNRGRKPSAVKQQSKNKDSDQTEVLHVMEAVTEDPIPPANEREKQVSAQPLDQPASPKTMNGTIQNDDRDDEKDIVEEDNVEEGNSRLLSALTKANPNSKKNAQLIRLTMDSRRNELQKISTKERIRNVMNKYPLFTKPQNIITNMVLQLPNSATETDMLEGLMDLCHKVVDIAAEKHLLKMPRASLINSDQVIAGGIMHMPVIVRGKGLVGRLEPTKFLVHILKRDEMLKTAVAEHEKIEGFYILMNKFGDEKTLIIMNKTEVVMKCDTLVDAILAFIGLYYLADLPYPAHLHGCLLVLQTEVLKDQVHPKDKTALQKAQKALIVPKHDTEYNI